MSSDDEWYESFKAVGEHSVFGQHLTRAEIGGYFGGGPTASPPVPSNSPLSTRFRYDPSYLRVDQISHSINNIKYPNAQWHNQLKELFPGEVLRVKQFKWITGSAIVGSDLPKDDDLGNGQDFPMSTLQWLINKFIISEGIQSSLRLIEFSGLFSLAILGTLGDGDQSELVQFLQYANSLTHLKIAHQLVPPRYTDECCSLVSDDPTERFDAHWHIPIACGIWGKRLKHLELILGHYDADSLTTLLDAPVSGALQRLWIQFRPVHRNVQLGEFFHTMTAVALTNLTHLYVGLSSCQYNANGRLPRFVGPNQPDPEHEPNFVGGANDTYFTAYMFDLATKLELFEVNFGNRFAGQPLLDRNFGPDTRRFLARQQSRPDQVLVVFDGVRVVGCQVRTFLLYLLWALPRMQVSTQADLITIANGSAKVQFKISRARDCSTRARQNNECGASCSFYPLVLHTLSALVLQYSDQHDVVQIYSPLKVPDCVLPTFTKDLNAAPTRQKWVYLCLPEIDIRDRARGIVYFYYRRTGCILEIIFENERCEFLDNCPVCGSQ